MARVPDDASGVVRSGGIQSDAVHVGLPALGLLNLDGSHHPLSPIRWICAITQESCDLFTLWGVRIISGGKARRAAV